MSIKTFMWYTFNDINTREGYYTWLLNQYIHLLDFKVTEYASMTDV